MRFVVACILLFASIVAACSEFSSQEGASSLPTDGGPNGLAPVTGTPSGVLAMTLPEGTTMLTHGNTERIRVSISRSGGFIGPVRFTLRGAPEGISANFLELEPGVTEGNLEVVIDPSFPQGPLPAMSIVASNATVGLVVPADFAAFVRGTPGEIDTTFADAGVLALPSGAYSAFEPESQNTIFSGSIAPDAPSGKFDIDGRTIDHYRSDLKFLDAEIAYNKGYLYNCTATIDRTASAIKLSVKRVVFDNGTDDSSYLRASDLTISGIARATIHGCYVFESGTVGVLYDYATSIESPLNIVWFHPDGSNSTTVSTAPATVGSYTNFRSSTQAGDIIFVLFVDGVRSYSASSFGVEPSFGGVSGIGTTISIFPTPSTEGATIGVDGSGRAVLSNTTTIARLQLTNGLVDGSFLVSSNTIAGGNPALAFQKDKKIIKMVRSGDAYSVCAALRYLENGTLDTSFGNNGVSTFTISPCSPGKLYVLPDGRVLSHARAKNFRQLARVFRFWS